MLDFVPCVLEHTLFLETATEPCREEVGLSLNDGTNLVDGSVLEAWGVEDSILLE